MTKVLERDLRSYWRTDSDYLSAVQAYRLATGAEKAVSQHGLNAKVQHVIVNASTSRSVFYKYFKSLDDLYTCMCRATNVMYDYAATTVLVDKAFQWTPTFFANSFPSVYCFAPFYLQGAAINQVIWSEAHWLRPHKRYVDNDDLLNTLDKESVVNLKRWAAAMLGAPFVESGVTDFSVTDVSSSL